jgi:hypothetical protein
MILILNYYFQQFQTGPDSFLDEIRSFGGFKGLKSKGKSNKNNELQELYNGLRLRVDILFTHKPVINLINRKFLICMNRVPMNLFFQSMV